MKISVCIATYNGSKYIVDQLNSILFQLDERDEIIISDDSSSDDTIDKIKSLRDNRIKIYSGDFKSPIYNFENSLKHANGDFIFLSDQDDVWLEGRVSEMLKQMSLGFDLVVSDCRIVDESLRELRSSYFEFNNSRGGFLKNLWRNSFMGCCMAFNRKILDNILPFPSKLPMHDSYIGLLAELKFNVVFLPKPLLLYRQHLNNASSTSVGISEYSFLTKMGFRIRLIYALCNKLIKI
ncbi:glycosyltransferase [Pedobacter panaciterrae]|uniref:glycosyltransferase n=1 Tax=Pedobacter panaciterrae TaxID=363849 RepID=UPI00155DD20A|nr:glycosyltransferase [Pedobacter panaciterrae]NQX55238.1 glycosyltransferase [Pedobacter panaciterrae]